MISRVYLWLFSLIISMQLYGQGRKKIELVVRDSIAYIKGSDMPYTGIGVVYADDLLTEKIHYVDGVRHGLTTKYYHKPNTVDHKGRVWANPYNGLLRYEVNYKQGIKHGVEYEYSEDGDVKHYVKYVDGQKDGVALGTVEYDGSSSFETYVHGKKEGVSLVVNLFQGNGMLYYANFVNDKEEGKVIGRFFSNNIPYGSNVSKYFYVNGKKEGAGNSKGMRGEVLMNFKNGKRHGVNITSDREKSVELYVNGKLEGVTKVYVRGVLLQSEIPYRNGKAHGVRKEFDFDGNVIKEIYYSQGIWVPTAKDIKEEVYKGVVVDEDSLVLKNGVAYQTDGVVPFTGKAEYFRSAGYFKIESFYKDGLKEKEIDYNEGFVYQRRYYEKGVLTREEYHKNRDYKEAFVFESSKVRPNDEKVVIRMYVGSESDNGELNIDANSEHWKRFSVNVINGRREGICEKYDDGVITPYEVVNYVNNRMEGQRVFERKVGDKLIINYKEGLKNGEALDFSKKKVLLRHTNYVNNREEGERISYYEDSGLIKDKSSYKYSVLHGESLSYNKNGKLITQRYYNYGLADGMMKEFYDSGRLKTEAFFVDNEYEGDVKTYAEDGKLIKVVNYSDGKLNGLTEN
ncbi:hypothetical protein HMPREF9713_02538 [Myroides odoratimimus CCUG 12700]|uniref:toxin-antitoxin system YwqK family antitoxin n=1 Tax=Myroides odoratimimus TaxID=76832 RepID=UPI000353F2C9|nr:hypothetical protein [Myroides odoratimimus]EPH10189.1 hypothetical protein HMPREF9713_02538 [Myroides odoratimimus CCUG 12700]